MCVVESIFAPHFAAQKLLSLRGGGRKPKTKKRPISGRGARHVPTPVHSPTGAAAVRNITVEVLDTDGDGTPFKEGPEASSTWQREGRKSASMGLDSILMAATANDASNEEDVDEVGLPYQQMTPLIRGHRDKRKQRDAESYCAEAARCLGRLEIEGAEACYQEALKLRPDAPWCASQPLTACSNVVELQWDMFCYALLA